MALKPYSLEHFRRYAELLVLDNGENWELEDFQAEVVKDVFSGRQEVWMVVPEGNGKTTLMAGIALYHADYTPDASVLLAASSRDQCGLLLGQAAGFVHRTPGLGGKNGRFRVFEGYRRIIANRTGGKIQVYAADDRTGDGAIPTLALIDELHRHRDMRLYRTWRGKLDKRGGQLLAISTAGEPLGEFEETRARALKFGKLSGGGRYRRAESQDMILHDWSLRTDDDPEDLALVKEANPFSGVTIERLRARRSSPAMTLAHWKRFTCNVAASEDANWLEDRSGWDSGARPGEEIPEGAEVVLGIDPAWHFDTCAVVALNVRGDGAAFAQPLAILKPDGGGSVPVWRVREAVLAAASRFRVKAIGYDRNRGFEQLAQELSDEHSLNMVAVSMSGAVWAPLTSELRAAINTGSITHPGDEQFTRHVLSGETKPSPEGPRLHGRTRDKVDALMALGIAWRLAFIRTKANVYERRDLLVLP